MNVPFIIQLYESLHHVMDPHKKVFSVASYCVSTAISNCDAWPSTKLSLTVNTSDALCDWSSWNSHWSLKGNTHHMNTLLDWMVQGFSCSIRNYTLIRIIRITPTFSPSPMWTSKCDDHKLIQTDHFMIISIIHLWMCKFKRLFLCFYILCVGKLAN